MNEQYYGIVNESEKIGLSSRQKAGMIVAGFILGAGAFFGAPGHAYAAETADQDAGTTNGTEISNPIMSNDSAIPDGATDTTIPVPDTAANNSDSAGTSAGNANSDSTSTAGNNVDTAATTTDTTNTTIPPGGDDITGSNKGNGSTTDDNTPPPGGKDKPGGNKGSKKPVVKEQLPSKTGDGALETGLAVGIPLVAIGSAATILAFKRRSDQEHNRQAAFGNVKGKR